MVGAVGQVDRRQHQHGLPLLAALDHHGRDRAGAPAAMKLEALHRKSSCHTRHTVRSVVRPIAIATSPVFNRSRSRWRRPAASTADAIGGPLGAAERSVDQAGPGHRERLGRDTEHGAVDRVRLLDVDRALRQDAGDHHDRGQRGPSRSSAIRLAASDTESVDPLASGIGSFTFHADVTQRGEQRTKTTVPRDVCGNPASSANHRHGDHEPDVKLRAASADRPRRRPQRAVIVFSRVSAHNSDGAAAVPQTTVSPSLVPHTTVSLSSLAPDTWPARPAWARAADVRHQMLSPGRSRSTARVFFFLVQAPRDRGARPVLRAPRHVERPGIAVAVRSRRRRSARCPQMRSGSIRVERTAGAPGAAGMPGPPGPPRLSRLRIPPLASAHRSLILCGVLKDRLYCIRRQRRIGLEHQRDGAGHHGRGHAGAAQAQ